MLASVPSIAAAADLLVRAGSFALKPKKGSEFKAYEAPTAYPPDNVLGSISASDGVNTETIVHYGLENVTWALKKASTTLDLSSMSCAAVMTKLNAYEAEVEKDQVDAHSTRFDAARYNSEKAIKEEKEKRKKNKVFKLEKKDPKDPNKDAKKASDKYDEATALKFQMLEAYTLKCGKIMPYCIEGQKLLLEEFRVLQQARETAMALATEAGWLQAEAEGPMVTQAVKDNADIKLKEAYAAQSDVWDRETLLEASINVKAAACGVVPPMGAWGAIGDGCGLPPKDPLLQALLKDHPDEFYMHWKKHIGEVAGLDPSYVKVTVLPCGSNAG